MDGPGRPATVADVHALAMSMPHVTRLDGAKGRPVYQVGAKSFIFFRNPRPDAADPATGERYPDVIVFWVESEAEKQSLVDDPDAPFFTTAHFDGHLSVLLRERDLPGLSYQELAEVVQDAWLSRASARRAADWLKSRGLPALARFRLLAAQQVGGRLVDLLQRAHQVLAFGRGEARGDSLFEKPPLCLDWFPKRASRVGEPQPDQAVVVFVAPPGDQPGLDHPPGHLGDGGGGDVGGRGDLARGAAVPLPQRREQVILAKVEPMAPQGGLRGRPHHLVGLAVQVKECWHRLPPRQLTSDRLPVNVPSKNVNR
jgi:hypothetical protein